MSKRVEKIVFANILHLFARATRYARVHNYGKSALRAYYNSVGVGCFFAENGYQTARINPTPLLHCDGLKK